jgi:hypothetical protein
VKLRDTSLSHIRGFNYQPSFSLHGLVRWIDRYDPAAVERELARGRALFPWMNAVRVWLSHDAWMADRDRFLANLRAEMAVLRRLRLKAMPVIFNGWHGLPDYGGLGPMAAQRSANAENRRRLFLDYVADVFAACAPEAETVCVWDLCNEPWLHYQDAESKVRAGFLAILQGAAAELRACGARGPIGVGNWGKPEDDRLCAPFVDCLLTHRYWAHQYMKFEWFEHNVRATVELANELGKPLVVSECTWGRWDDAERAEAMAREIDVIAATGAGFLPYVLWESPVADCHGKAAGFTYDADAPGDLCFIRRDGSLRPGHDRINDVVARHPAPAPR